MPIFECDKCKRTGDEKNFKKIENLDFCIPCANAYVEEKISAVIATTTNNIDGFSVDRYIDIESIEHVIGTGPISEFTSDVEDFFGRRSSAFERKLKEARELSLKNLKLSCFEKGGNAILGICFNYTEFSGNRIGLITSGTIVKIK